MKMKRVLSLLLALVMTMSLLTLPSYAADDDTVTVTVNYVYDSNKAMVAQPYTAQLAKGAAFQKTISVPTLLNYSVPADKVEGLGSGITFADNTLSFDLASVTSDVTVTLYYVAGQAEYTVNHHYQNLNDDEYGEVETVTIEGDIDAYTNAAATSKPGFICTGVPQYTIAADGTTVVDIYYNRAYYTVVFDVNGGINGPKPVYGKYGTPITISSVPTRAGYVFAGWGAEVSETIVANETYQAQWLPAKGEADYTIVIWGQNANDDEYSYLNSYPAHGAPGDSATWSPDTFICEGNHTHSAECYEMNCGMTEHTHASCDLNCGKVEHKHTSACCSLEEHEHSFWCIFGCIKDEHTHGDGKCNTAKCSVKYEHTHSNACYGCGKVAHTHSDLGGSCYTLTCTKQAHTHTASCQKMGNLAPDSSLWVYDHSDTVTVDADGSTVLNVYFNREEFTVTFYQEVRRYWQTCGTITDRWGANIQSRYEAICNQTGIKAWTRTASATSFLNYMGVMPKANTSLYEYNLSGSSGTMSYYGKDLNGKDQLIFSVTANFGDATVDDNDKYEFEGYTYRRTEGTYCQGAKHYYDRNSYDLVFYSASTSTPDKTESVKYQANLGSYYYDTPARPAGMESDAVFVGWYLNPERSGQQFDLAAHNMPAKNIALYAKWVNGLYNVTTYNEDGTLYTYDGYSGKQENIVKYTKAPVTPTDPAKDGYVFAGWFYQDADGREQPFSFTMPITQNYDLYPKFTNQAVVSYTVHYYQEGTDTKLADDRTNAAMIGTTVTEKAKMGTELNLADAEHNYFPDKTSTSVVLNGPDMEITFYYKKDITVPYTVKYVDEHNMPLIGDKVVTNNQFSVVTETYVSIAHYTPQQYQITKELSTDDPSENVIVFVYTAEKYTITYDANGGTLAGADQVKYTVNDAITLAAAPTLEGYNFTGWKLDAAAGNWIAGDYTAQQSVDAGKYGNVTFVAQWQEKTANIKYEVVGPTTDCGTVNPTNETVKVVTGTANGSTATASSNNYKFVGWYDNKDCTGNPLSTDANYVPTKADGDLWVDGTTYYAKFEWNIADLTITKKAAQGTTIDEGQSFIFRVTGNGVDMYVTVQGADSVTIKDLLVGKYTVTEMTNWSWRYTPDEGGAKDVTVNGGVENTVTFTNTRTNPYWLSGDNYAINRVDGRVVNK